MYSKTMTYNAELNIIKLVGLHDRAYVFVNDELIAVRQRGFDESVIEYPRYFEAGDKIDILIENMGRICYGEDMYFGDRKGIDGAIIMTHKKGDEIRNPGKVIFNWDVRCFDMDNVGEVKFEEKTASRYPAFFKGTFKANGNDSCFVHFDNFKKGLIFVNGFNLGRYWEKGPLEALYIPGVILKEENEIVIFEAEGLRGDLSVEINNICGIPNHHPEIIVE
jgi:beta-galactosidase